MTIEEALAKATSLRRTTLAASVSVSLHGDGANGPAFAMYYVNVDAVSAGAEPSFEACFERLDKELWAQRQERLARLEMEIEQLREVAR